MKIAVFCPKSEFTSEQQTKLASLGEVVYTENRNELPIEKLIEFAEGADIIAADPDNFGGFEKAKTPLTKLIEAISNVKSVALSTTSTEWVDLAYFKSRNISVSNIPHYSTESVAEHTLGLLICLAKNIIINDRKYWAKKESKYGSTPGFELKGKTLGVIGLGSIGTRVAELGKSIGMNVIAYNRTPKNNVGVKIKSLDEVLSQSDVISLHIACDKNTYHFISKKEIQKMKTGVIIADLIGPVPPELEVVDKKDMAEALIGGRVKSYAYEAENLESNPLSKIETAIGLKGFAWYTSDSLNRAKEIWIENIIFASSGKPQNVVN